MITLSNGYAFEYMAASGALAYDGLGWWWEQPLRWCGLLDPALFTVVTKTLTRHPRRGNLRWYNPLRAVRFVQGGVVNAVGLTNPGVEWWCDKIAPRLDRKKIPLVVSIWAGNIGEVIDMAALLKGRDLVAIEINASCPNTVDRLLSPDEMLVLCDAARVYSGLPVILKVSTRHDPATFGHLFCGFVEAVAVNSVPWPDVYGDRPSPLARFGGGGVSGRAAQRRTWTYVHRFKRDVPDLPIICPGMWDESDLTVARHVLGADAVSFGSIFLRHPWRPTGFVRRDLAWKKKRRTHGRHDQITEEVRPGYLR